MVSSPPHQHSLPRRFAFSVCDLIKLSPSIAWLITCLTAIPAYSGIGWATPVILAVLSSILAIFATYDIFKHHAPNLSGAMYALLPRSESEETKNQQNLTLTRARTKMYIASACTFISFMFTVVFLAIAYGTVKSKSEIDGMPCEGKCEDCEIDPDCSNWISEMEDKYPALKICPPAKKSADTDVTFSCLADGFWMLTTTLVGAVWVFATLRLVKRARVQSVNDKPPRNTDSELQIDAL
mmetsp:Transcript_5514/g.11048  ORF Transcript_5514/g.11048 Transcript_5514/m.11048 type:complete len:239 (-) Transcript_5514:19-735(-)